jgi:5-hydroxyisourate hydrolase
MALAGAQEPGLTVHVLDTAHGRPAVGLSVALYRIDGAARTALGTWLTNADGRCDGKLLDAATMRAGAYEVVFDVAGWRKTSSQAEPGFYDLVPIRFVVADAAAHYHIPLLISPYGYSTYRGS